MIAARLGTPFMPWQQDLADLAYELDDDGRLFYSEIDLTVPRQSGKTAYVLTKTVHRLTVMAKLLGDQRSTYLAQRRLDARKKLEFDFAVKLRKARGFREVPTRQSRPKAPTQWRLSLNNGMEHIQFGAGSLLQIDAPSETGGHGDTTDDGTIDEAFAHQDDDAEGALRPSQATRESAQLMVVSTAGNEKSFYLWRKVLAGRKQCESGEHGRVAYVEYSAEDDAPYDDPKTWASCSPALGHTINLSFIQAEWDRLSRLGPKGVDTFRRAYLNQWPQIPILDDEEGREIAPAAWAACYDPKSGPVGPLEWAVDVSPDRSSACIMLASTSGRGGVHLETVRHPSLPPGHGQVPRGTSWVVEEAKILTARHGGRLAIAKGSPAWSLEPDLRAAGVELVEVSTEQHAQACGSLQDAVAEKTVKHGGDPALRSAVENAVAAKYGKDAWLWYRKESGGDITPIVAATLARWVVVSVEDAVLCAY